MNILVSELFALVEKAESRDQKIDLLRKNDCGILRFILSLNFNPDFNLTLPEGAPPYKKDSNRPIGYQQTTLQNEWRRMYIWQDPNINLTRLKKESLFIEMLEGLHYTEADLLCASKDGNLETIYKSITEDLIRDAYPNIFPFPPTIKEEVSVPAKKPARKKKEALV